MEEIKMKKSKLLLMTLLVFMLSIALVACGKDEKKDDDDKETSAPKATVEADNNADDNKEDNKEEVNNKVDADNKEDAGDADNKEDAGDADNKEDAGDADNKEDAGDADNKEDAGDADNKEDAGDASTGDATVITLAKNWLGSVIDAGKVESMSMGGKAVIDLAYQGAAVKLNASMDIDVTKDPLVMQMLIDMSGDAAGTPMNMKLDCYAVVENGEAFLIMNDPTGASEGYFKFAAEDIDAGDLVDSMTEMAKSFEDMDFSTIDKEEALKELDELLAPYADVVGAVKVVEEGGEYVIAGTITEEQINAAIEAAKTAAGDQAASLETYISMIPKGYGGIDYRIAFDKSSGAFKSAKVDVSKLVKAFTGEAGENYVEINFSLDDVSSITVPEAELADPSMMQ